MKTLGIVFSNLHDKEINELTAQRTLASVPFGGRYRLIDFVLSNMVNSGIYNVGNELVGHAVRVDALPLHLFHDYFCVGGGFADVVARAPVAALDHVSQNHDQTALQLCDLLALLLNLADVAHGV